MYRLARAAPRAAAVVPSRSLSAGSEILGHLADATLTEDQTSYRDLARQFAADELAPHAAEWDRTGFFPVATLKQASALGFGAMFAREEFGGTGLTRSDGAVIVEELAAGCTSTTAYLTIHNMCAWMVDTFGSTEVRKKWVPQFAAMDILSSYCLTEPGSGSDAVSLTTKAVKNGDHYVLNGSKAFISGGGVSDVYLVMCRTGGAGAGGISCLLVEKSMPGVSFGENEKKMGWRNQPTCAVFFDNVKVPVGNLIGAEGEGFKIAMKGLDGGRLSIGACSLGAAKAALACAMDYSGERQQFGKPIAANQALAFMMADNATALHGARLVLRHAAGMLDALKAKGPAGVPGGPAAVTAACAMAKVTATDVGFKVCNDALQVHGGYGYLNAYPVERMVRDVRVHQILEGTNQIMRHIVARTILK